MKNGEADMIVNSRITSELALPLPIAEPEDVEGQDYSVTFPVEIRLLLNGILEEKSLISLHLSRSNHSIILSSILAVDSREKILVLDYGIDEPLNQLALKRGSLRCITALNRVRVEFDCNNLQRIQFEGRSAFSADIPVSLQRLQRRNFYRIATPVTTPAVCSILSLRPCEEISTFNLLDISCGGMALIDQPDTDILLKIGMVFEYCRIDLPEFGVVETSIQIKNAGTIILKNGLSYPRISCEFLNLSEKSRMLIQRYIIKLEQQARKFDRKPSF